MVLKVNSQSGNAQAKTTQSIVLELVKAHARSHTSSVTDLTDSSGGTPAAALTPASTSLVNTANSGTNLASKATADAALVTVVDALNELFTKANAFAVKLGVDQITYSGGGAAADGTIAAVTVSTTAAATGAQATATNAALAAINTAFYQVGILTNKIATATGKTKIVLPNTETFTASVAALATSTGTAADPGITKVAFDAELVKLRNNVATVATVLNTLNDAAAVAAVIAV